MPAGEVANIYPAKEQRVVEAYVGEYASGKSEVAINRALFLAAKGRQVTIADLDLVEPFYTLRPIKKVLEAKGLKVIAWDATKATGLGEAGTVILPEARWVLRNPGDIILDIGYGVKGARSLNLLHGYQEVKELRVYAVANISRPVTGTEERIVEYIKSLGRVDGLINNTHLGDDTDVGTVQRGAAVVSDAAARLGLPVIFTSVEEKLAPAVGRIDERGNPVFVLRRYMPGAFW
ncbi:MAG: hypothetical protein KGZ75_05680 [Syntrophomonadaceae bacterium]|nr:hypothetical protein [Syntrophomonadaceae bacterium]